MTFGDDLHLTHSDPAPQLVPPLLFPEVPAHTPDIPEEAPPAQETPPARLPLLAAAVGCFFLAWVVRPWIFEPLSEPRKFVIAIIGMLSIVAASLPRSPSPERLLRPVVIVFFCAATLFGDVVLFDVLHFSPDCADATRAVVQEDCPT